MARPEAQGLRECCGNTLAHGATAGINLKP